MSAAAERQALARIGRGLIDAGGDAGARRAAPLLGRATGAPPPSRFAALAAVPDWLCRPRADQVALARLVALRSIAGALSASIDGAWLGALATRAGEDALDWAMARGVDAPATGDPLAPDDLEPRGFAILRAALPPELRPYLAWAPGDAVTPAPTAIDPAAIDPAAISDALAFLSERAA